MRRRSALVVVLVLAAGLTAAARRPAPSRIVSTSPSITEMLFALGLGDRVVGVSAHCRYPPAAALLPRVGSFLKPDAERIAGLRPDLVLVHDVSDGLGRRLDELKLRHVVVDPDSLSGVFGAIGQIATAAGVPARADPLVAAIRAKLDALKHGRGTAARPRVLFIIGRRSGMLADLVGVGPGSYINELLAIAGGVNILDVPGQPDYPRISMEAVLRFDPDVIIDTADMGESEAARPERQRFNERLWSAYPSLTAVRTKRLYAATTNALVVPGPRVVDAARWVAQLLDGTSPR